MNTRVYRISFVSRKNGLPRIIKKITIENKNL